MDEQPKTENDATDASAAESVKISINEPQTANDQATPVINDITPPPAETSEETSSAPEAEATPVAEPPADENDTQETEAPKEEVQTEPEEMLTEEPQPEIQQPQDSPQAEQATPMTTAEPAVMGVAASEMGKSSHRNNKKFAALITIFVAILLAGVAVFVYMSTNKNAKEQNATDTPLQTQQDTVVAPASVEDVDQTSEEVEEAVNSLDETEDFADSELSDSNLEL